MNKVFAALTKSWPALSEIDWQSYSSPKLNPYDESQDNLPKWTGLLMHIKNRAGPTVAAHTQQLGCLLNPANSASVMMRKIEALQDEDPGGASLFWRDLTLPGREVWSGSIISSSGEEIYAITGQPEIGDHLILAHHLRVCGVLNADHHQELTNWSFNRTLRKTAIHVGMKEDQFLELSALLWGIAVASVDE